MERNPRSPGRSPPCSIRRPCSKHLSWCVMLQPRGGCRRYNQGPPPWTRGGDTPWGVREQGLGYSDPGKHMPGVAQGVPQGQRWLY